ASNYGGFFDASRRADAIYDAAHAAAADLLGASSGREIVLGQSMTTLTFQISRSLGRGWRPGDEVIVTRMDHEANVSPWLRLAEERQLIVRWLPFNRETWRIEPEDLQPLLNERTRLLALNHASNMTGSINDVAALSALAKQAGALVYVDAVQFAPHGLIDVAGLGCDFLVCSAYKFFGPHLAVLWGREAILADLYPYAVRCASPELPHRHELGTPQTELLAGLTAAVDYLAWLGEATGGAGTRRQRLAGAYAAATAHEMRLAQDLIDELRSIPQVTVRGIANPNRLHERVPTVSITHPGHSNRELAQSLGQQGFNLWYGHNYAMEAARHLGLDEKEGVLRIGLAHYNTTDEVDRVLAALNTSMR
ncbi:MAG TPA: cysteine desulfurase-like protein, partial [Kiloniellales bacterium]|nr:cysteine desulfurase-like protein [Kiloniellales bacterium]